jgi:hypothetical protein
MAMVPKGPNELVPYDTRGLTRSQQRRMDARIRDDAEEQELHARHYRREQRNLHRQVQVVGEGLTELNADFQSKINASDSPRLEDALEELWEETKDLSRGILRRGYGNG